MTKPNILLIIIDSLRYDKCHGNQKTSLTPNIDILIKNGVSFEQAISPAAATSLAVTSILTGLYPFNAGVGGQTYQKVNSSIKNYIKILNENGYTTFSTAPSIANDFGLTCDIKNKDSSYDNYFGLFAGLGNQIMQKLDSNVLKKPWFFYMHIYDLHTPIKIPQEFNDVKFGETQYEKMVSAIDFWIGNFLKKINLEETLVILTSDHGEYIPMIKNKDEIINLEPGTAEINLWNLGNRIPKKLYPFKKMLGLFLRKTRIKSKFSKISNMSLTPYQRRTLLESRMGSGHRMYDDLIHVPLIFSGINIQKNLKILQQVRHIDIFPTILNLISIDDKSEKDGTSLLPLFSNNNIDELPICIESPPSMDSKSKKFIGIRTSNYKYIRDLTDSENCYELYDLKNDPLEETNIANSNKIIVEKMENLLNQYRQQTKSNEDEHMTPEEIKQIEDKLKKLGYR